MNKKSHFIFLSIKQNILPTIFCLFTICLVIFSKQNLVATKNGLLLWANAVVPSLLPFFIATELLGHTNVVSNIGKLLDKVMKPIFNVPGEGAYAFIMGIISGYPIGAKIVTKFRQDGICTKAECERLLAFTNNSGPLFIISTVGISLFCDTRTGLLLFVTHLLACVCVGIIFRFWKFNDKELVHKKTANLANISSSISFSNLGEVLGSSITNSINTVVTIGGFVVLFSVILSILDNSGLLSLCSNIISPFFTSINIDISFSKPLLSGIIELTNGVKQIANISSKTISNNIVFAAFLLGFGGISILLQVLSIISKSDISIKPYILGKFLHGIIAAFLTYIVIHNFSFFSLDVAPVFAQNVTKHNNIISSYYNFYNIFILALATLFILFLFIKKIKRA